MYIRQSLFQVFLLENLGRPCPFLPTCPFLPVFHPVFWVLYTGYRGYKKEFDNGSVTLHCYGDMAIELSVKCVKDGIEFAEETATSQDHRQKTLSRHLTAERRKTKLDKYFSAHPPNGRLVDVFRDCLNAFRRRSQFPVEYHNLPPAWLDWPAVFDSIERLQKKGVLTVTVSEGIKGTKIYQSTSTMKQQNKRDSRTDELITRLHGELANSLAVPAIVIGSATLHGCQEISPNRCRVRPCIGGRIRSLGTYDFSTAVRLADAINYHFSAYRKPGKFNVSVEQATITAQLPAVAIFLSDLESHWLATGIIGKPDVDPIAALESRVCQLEKTLAEVLTWKVGVLL